MHNLSHRAGMNRESSPLMPNQMTSDQYTSLNGNPQFTLNRQYQTQDQLGKVVTSGSQRNVDVQRTVNEEVRKDAQKQYEAQRGLNNYITDNLVAAGEANELMVLGQGDPESYLRVLQASKQYAMGMNVDPLCC